MCATMQKLRIWSSFKRGLVTEERRRPWSGRPVKPGRACGHENCRRKGATRVGPHRRTWSHALAKYSGHKKGSSGYFGRTPEKKPRADLARGLAYDAYDDYGFFEPAELEEGAGARAGSLCAGAERGDSLRGSLRAGAAWEPSLRGDE